MRILRLLGALLEEAHGRSRRLQAVSRSGGAISCDPNRRFSARSAIHHVGRTSFQRRRGQFPDPEPRAWQGLLARAVQKIAWFRDHFRIGLRIHRGVSPAFYRLSALLWGRNPEPPRYNLVSFLFLRLFGLIYLSAFISFAVQAQGLIGSHGILPVTELVNAVASRYGPERFFLIPMVFWLNASDFAIQAVCWAGAGLSMLLVFNLLPRLSLFLLYVLYLSLFYGGQTFMNFQWDTFLLEAGFIALLLSCATTPGIWLLRWLLFRFMFMSGVVKLLSGDPNWWNLSALSYHFLTQPLPTPLAWYAAQLPPSVLKFTTGSMFFIELALPFLIFSPRWPRFFAAFGILLLESCILITGNYNWFNLQTMLLCLPLFDDTAIQKILPRRLAICGEDKTPRRPVTILVVNALALLIASSLVV